MSSGWASSLQWSFQKELTSYGAMQKSQVITLAAALVHSTHPVFHSRCLILDFVLSSAIHF